jgi:hypothetical protein
MYGIWPAHNEVNDALFDACTFTCTNQTIDGSAFGVVTLGQGGDRTHQRITFLNCTLTSNTGTGSGGGDGGVNGVKVVSGYGNSDRADDISFVGCSFGTPGSGYGFSRMGYEQVGPLPQTKNVLFRDCDFEPVGSECISENGGDLYHLFENCTFKGAGMYAPSSWAGSCFESNTGRYIELRDCHFWASGDGAFNCNGTQNCYIIADGCDIDMRTHYQSVGISSDCHLFRLGATSGFSYINGTIVTGDATHYPMDCGDAPSPAEKAQWPQWIAWESTTGVDFSGTTICGYVSYGTGSPHVPTTIIGGHWDEHTNTDQVAWPTIIPTTF